MAWQRTGWWTDWIDGDGMEVVVMAAKDYEYCSLVGVDDVDR